MPVDDSAVQDALADAWDKWARRCARLSPTEWTTTTRCDAWDVQALVAHLCPDSAMFDMLDDAIIDGPAAVTDPADLLRRFNAADGVAHTMADELAEQAIADAGQLTAEAAATRFADSAARIRATPFPPDSVIAHPIVGSTTLAVIARVALMEATVHMLDLADAVGGVEPSSEALALTRDLLIAVPDPTSVVEVLAGRAAPEVAVPAIR